MKISLFGIPTVIKSFTLKLNLQKCIETELDGHKVISLQSEKAFEEFRCSKLSPQRVPPLDFVPKASSPPVKTITKKNRIDSDRETPRNTPKNVSSVNDKTTDSDATVHSVVKPTLNLSDYHPDTESGESRLSDTTEYFR